MSPDQTQLLVAFLHERDVACPRCAYNLRNATTSVCSECGLPIELGVRTRLVISGHWIAAVTIYGSSALLGIFFLTLVLRIGWPDSQKLFTPANLSLMGYMIQIPVAVAVLMARRRVIRWPRGAQMALWISGAALASALLMALVIWLR